MPEVTDNGKTYTFRIRKGIYFTPDPAFKGAKRELVAQDFVYSFMRFMDPKNRSPYAFLLEGKIEGLDELAAQAKKTGKFDYDAKVRRHGGGRPLHAALPAEEDRLQLPLHRRARAVRRRRARGDRSLRRRHRWRIRSAPARTC